MIENKEWYDGYVIDHAPGNCWQRRSIRSEQNHSSVSAFIGKELTDE